MSRQFQEVARNLYSIADTKQANPRFARPPNVLAAKQIPCAQCVVVLLALV